MIPADQILTFIAIVVIGSPAAWLALRWAGRAVARKRARLVEPVNCGDQGSMPEHAEQARPKAPETGSGLHVGGEWD
jgi:hypothetical protein